MFVRSVNIRGTEDCTTLAVEVNCDVLVAAASLDEESPFVIDIKLGKWEVRDEELVGRGKVGGLVAGIAAWFQ